MKVTARQEIECKSCVFGSPDKIRDKRARVMLDSIDLQTPLEIRESERKVIPKGMRFQIPVREG